jgi:hypothetical protein
MDWKLGALVVVAVIVAMVLDRHLVQKLGI